MSTILLILMESLAIVALIWYCVTGSADNIENDIAVRTAAALNYAGIHDVKVIADGQTILLQGRIDSNAAKNLATSTATATWGVEAVSNHLQVSTTDSNPVATLSRQHSGAHESPAPGSGNTAAGQEAGRSTSKTDAGNRCNATLDRVIKKSRIRFERGSDELTADSRTLLDTIANALLECPLKTLKITGHTDGTGSEADNLLLSRQRAAAVAAYLRSRRLPPQRLKIEGRGETQPIADNATREGREKNRRIEFTLIEPPKPPIESGRKP